MALGLTTSAMSAVFNMLAGMGGRTVGGFLMLIIIFPLGHAINFGLNILGAYVHTLRPVSYTHLDVYKRQPQYLVYCAVPKGGWKGELRCLRG